jgi:GDP-4-dehydro-6-deoxy-D-mannose reductase
VYGRISANELPITEQTATRPNNNYSLSKLMAEEVCQRYARYGKIAVGIARPFNHLGRRQSVSFVASSFAHQLALIATGKKSAVVEVGNLAAGRDFSDVRDVVRGYCLLAEHIKVAPEQQAEVYNFCSGKPVAIATLLKELISISGLNVELREVADRMRPSEVPSLFGSAQKAHDYLGWEPTYSLRDTLTEVYKHALEVNR